ncbi:MAG: hypothetical protein ACR2O4_07440 [Hyphomicrobiaceae bacterium]
MEEKNHADRISFHPDLQVMEVDFSDMTFDVSKPVNAFYDEVDRQLEATGQKWFFLVNYRNCTIMPEAWIAFAHRGKKVNLAYSLGSARFSASADTSEAIREKSEKEDFAPNLFSSRDAALAHLQEQREKIPTADYQMTITKESEPPGKSIDERVIFLPELEVMEVDFSDYTFATSADVNAFYDTIGSKIRETNRDWYFMVNYDGTEILPDAWYRWYLCSKRLNTAHSLGTVRFNPQTDTREQILTRARAEDDNPNLVTSREDALLRIEEMKQAPRTNK